MHLYRDVFKRSINSVYFKRKFGVCIYVTNLKALVRSYYMVMKQSEFPKKN